MSAATASEVLRTLAAMARRQPRGQWAVHAPPRALVEATEAAIEDVPQRDEQAACGQWHFEPRVGDLAVPFGNGAMASSFAKTWKLSHGGCAGGDSTVRFLDVALQRFATAVPTDAQRCTQASAER